MKKEKQTILLVEDDVALRRVLVDKLTDEGFAVLEAADGEQGLVVAAEKHPELIFKQYFSVDRGLEDSEAQKVASQLSSDPKVAAAFAPILKALAKLYVELDASLVEINPLAHGAGL